MQGSPPPQPPPSPWVPPPPATGGAARPSASPPPTSLSPPTSGASRRSVARTFRGAAPMPGPPPPQPPPSPWVPPPPATGGSARPATAPPPPRPPAAGPPPAPRPGQSPAGPTPPPAPQRRWRVRHPKRLLLVLLILVALAALSWLRCGIRGCPDVARLGAYQPDGAPLVLDRYGEEVGELALTQQVVVALDELPEHVPEAFLAVEDKRFSEHNGVDWRRVGGALFANVRAGGIREGSSTITMQLARNLFAERIPGQERTFSRKLLEVRVARQIERAYEKDEILELYLNHIYFGGGTRGIEAASQYYFRKPASARSEERRVGKARRAR